MDDQHDETRPWWASDAGPDDGLAADEDALDRHRAARAGHRHEPQDDSRQGDAARHGPEGSGPEGPGADDDRSSHRAGAWWEAYESL